MQKKQENRAHKEKKQSIVTVLEMTWMITFVDMYITIAFRNMLHVIKKVEESERDKENMIYTCT